jgi:hypothetical protein
VNFPDFVAALHKLSSSELEGYRKTDALKTSILGRVTVDCLKEKDEAIKKMSSESKKLKREFNLARVANIDLEKKVANTCSEEMPG